MIYIFFNIYLVYLNGPTAGMKVVPQFRVDVLHVPAERLAVQLPAQQHTVCDAATIKKKTCQWLQTEEETEVIESSSKREGCLQVLQRTCKKHWIQLMRMNNDKPEITYFFISLISENIRGWLMLSFTEKVWEKGWEKKHMTEWTHVYPSIHWFSITAYPAFSIIGPWSPSQVSWG